MCTGKIYKCNDESNVAKIARKCKKNIAIVAHQ